MHLKNCLWIVCAITVLADSPDPSKLKREGYISDFAHVIDQPARQRIDQYCSDYLSTTNVTIALVTIPTLNGNPIEDFSNKLFHSWGIGQKDTAEGVMVVLSIKDRKSRVEVGYGLEPYLTDGVVGEILRSAQPLLRQNNYGDAMEQIAHQIGEAVRKGKDVDVSTSPPQPSSRQDGGWREINMPGMGMMPLPVFVFMLVFLALALGFYPFMIISSIWRARRTRRTLLGGGATSPGPGNSSSVAGSAVESASWSGGGGLSDSGSGAGSSNVSGVGGGDSSSSNVSGFGGGDSGGGGASSDW
jgi:uncharacterized protein